jgi:hypothetical protein
VASWTGYLPPQSIGHLAANAAAHYRNSLVDVEMQGGYGEAVLVGLHERGHKRLAVDDRESRGGALQNRYGFSTNNVTRGLYVGAAQDAILRGGVEVLSSELVNTLLAVRMDTTGKVLAREGEHDEGLILFGRAAHWMGTHPPKPLPKAETVEGFMAKVIAQQKVPMDPRREALQDAFE